MKTRLGFVSNSSSASFVIDKRYTTAEMIQRLKDYCNNIGEGENQCWDYWVINENEDFVSGFTTMDNGGLYDWICANLDIPLKAVVHWGD